MNILERILIEPVERFYERIIQFLPNLLTFVLILVIGFLLGAIFRWGFLRIFRAVGLDQHLERFGMVEILGKGGIKEPASLLLARIIRWITIFTFVVISLNTLNFPTVERLLERFFLYLPSIFAAAVIILVGYLLSNFFGRAALIASVNAGIRVSGMIGKLVKLTIFLLAITMALEQLGIGAGAIVIAFAIIFGGVVLALAIAFGLGGRDIAKEYLEKKMQGKEEKDEIRHL